ERGTVIAGPFRLVPMGAVTQEKVAMRIRRQILIPAVPVLVTSLALAAGQPRGPDLKDVQATVDRAVAYLAAPQGQDGTFAPRLGGPGVSALVAAGLIRQGRTDAPVTQKTLSYLEKSVKPDGGIYDRGLANYTTSVALIAFHEANAKGKYDAII